jgi:signal transduction histidine kinase
VERELFTIAGWALLGALVSLAIGFLVSRRMLRRVEAVNAVCDRVVRGDWGARAAGAEAADEFGALSRHVNGMLEHIDALVLGMSNVSDVIAHDLRTPIARLKTALEDAAAAPTLDAARAGVEAAAEEAGEILVTFQALLDINEAEAGGDGRLQPMRLDETARSIVKLYDPLAEAAGVRLVCEVEPASMLGKPPQIERLAANLLDNAIKFSPPGGEVRVSVEHRGGEVILRVADQGPGIPASEREAVMGRRVRGDGARATPGHGVGLGIVKAVVVGHGSKWRMDDAEPGLIVSIPFKAF